MLKALLLKRAVVKMASSNDFSASQQAQAQQILKSAKGMRMLRQHVSDLATHEGALIGKLGDGKILQWLMDHAAQIMAFIQMIIALFPK